MRKNWIQFQKGLSQDDFQRLYGTDAQCREVLMKARWPDGFVCPTCGATEHCVLSRRQLCQCNRCRTQTSITAGTIFQATKLPLRKWFLAVHFITKAKNGISSLELARDLGVRQMTAWTVKQKIMQVMKEREKDTILSGRVEVDDSYLGGELQGGKPGRGSQNKIPFIAAVETNEEGHPTRALVQRVENFSKKEVSKWVETKIEMGTLVVTDGHPSFGAVTEALSSHKKIVARNPRQAAKHPAVRWVNTALGNLKTLLRGTYHAIRRSHVPRYLASFQYRFNRRSNLPALLGRLVHAAVRTPPMPYPLLKLAEPIW